MKKKVLTIVVEAVNREMDNALLLKAELERRGYLVNILNKTDQISKKRTDILLIPNCYNKKNVEFYRYRFNCNNWNIVNLQYEQILSKSSDNCSFFALDDMAKKVIHLSWGKHAADRLKEQNVLPEKNIIVGAMQMDFTRTEFLNFWKSKNLISHEFLLPLNKKWILFISSFSAISENVNNAYKEDFDEERIIRQRDRAINSQKAILDWIDKFLRNNKEYIFIYRPHPAEINSPSINIMLNKHPDNFKCIIDYNVKQWIYVCDVITTWFSTAIVEAYFMKKNCIVVRPYKIELTDECAIYIGGDFAKTFEEFEKQILNYKTWNNNFSLNPNLIESYYDQSKIPSFIRVANVIDEINNKTERIAFFRIKRLIFFWKNHIIGKIIIKFLYKKIYRFTGKKIQSQFIRAKFFVEEWEKSVDNHINDSKVISEKEKYMKILIDNYEKKRANQG